MNSSPQASSGASRLNREIEECAEWQASNKVLSMHGFDACHAAQFSQTRKRISDLVPHEEHQTCPQSTTSAIRVLRSALAICHHGATSQAVNLSRRFDLHDFVDLCRHEWLRKVYSVVIHCLVKMVMRTSLRNEQIRQSMIIAHEVPGFGRESTVHDVTPLKPGAFDSANRPFRPKLVAPHICSIIVSHESCSTSQRKTSSTWP